MNFITKRQKFASEQRQKHREEIFKKHRTNCIAEQNKSGILIGKTSKNNDFIFAAQIKSIQLTAQGIEPGVRSGMLQKIFQQMPKWIVSLTQQKPQQSDPSVLHSFLNISLFCLTSKKLVVEVTNCLVQLTGLSSRLLKQIGIFQEELAQKLTPIIYQTLQQSSNMQIIFNCVYISGNLYETFRYLYLNPSYREGEMAKSQTQIYSMELEIIGKMMQICSNYPNFQNCLEVMIWFMKNSIIVSHSSKNITKNKLMDSHSTTNEEKEYSVDTQRQIYFTQISEKIILLICSKSVELNNGTNDQYYCKILEQAFYLLKIIVGDPDLYFHEMKMIGSKKVYSVKNHFPQILSSINFVTHTFQGSWTNSIQNNKRNKTKPLIASISQVLEQILWNLAKTSNFQTLLPNDIPTISFLVAEGKIKCSESVSLCGRTLESTLHSNIPDLYQLGKSIVKIFMQNILKIYGEKEIIADRQYRIRLMEMFKQMEDLLSYTEIRGIINQIVSESLEGKQQMSEEPVRTKNSLHLIYESYMLSTALPPILNIIDLFLIDEDTENRALGMKVICNLSMVWQISTAALRNLVVNMGFAQRILQMQDEREQWVYSLALDLIGELQLDEGDF